jgi:hypothetical protein
MRVLKYAVACIVLVSATGCIGTEQPLTIPTELMQPCLAGKPLGTATNQELSDTVAALASTLKQCNLDKEGLRAWANKANG